MLNLSSCFIPESVFYTRLAMFYTQSVVRRPQSLFYTVRIFDFSKDLTQTPGNHHLMLIMKNAPHITTKAPRIMMTNKAPRIM